MATTCEKVSLDMDRLRPARSHTLPDIKNPKNTYNKQEHDEDNTQFPRIVVRDRFGHRLDTFTALQEAIYRARWQIRQTNEAKYPNEWRLPHGPLPARPDFSRNAPPFTGARGRLLSRQDRRTESAPSPVIEIDVEDVAFVAESLNHLPNVPSLSFLRHEILAGPKTYFQIVGGLLLHKKLLSQTDKRQAIYNFPGFCSGCQRIGLCYGCERGLEPHYHEDRPMKTGGGFTYFKRDRPEFEMKDRNPSNWRIHFPEVALKKLMKEHGMPEELKKKLEGKEDKPALIFPLIPEFSEAFQNLAPVSTNLADEEDEKTLYDEDGDLDEGIGAEDDDQFMQDELTPLGGMGGKPPVLEEKFKGGLRGRNTQEPPEDRIKSVGSEERNYTNALVESLMEGVTPWGQTGRQVSYIEEMSVEDVSGTKKENEGKASSDKDTGQSNSIPPKSSEGSQKTDKSSIPGQGKKRERLYKQQTPPMFKLKARDEKVIESKDPFSTDRTYNLPKGKGMDIKKSDKALTKFDEFKGGEGDWKEPKKI